MGRNKFRLCKLKRPQTICGSLVANVDSSKRYMAWHGDQSQYSQQHENFAWFKQVNWISKEE